MSAICLIVAGVVRAALPGPEFTLSWDHSVEKVRWEERYRATNGQLVLVEARVKGSGAGMEPPPGSTLRDGSWVWQPRSTHAELRLTRSTFTRDYVLCAVDHCATLGDRVGATADGDVVTVRPCGSESAPSAGRQQVGR
ncbi:MAG TPA: DUF1850 domain-containing protein [Casimicrobiaceae bacterium]|nr:DUF1850 domain-containing protein [Casimicrobiaceae bacterium]